MAAALLQDQVARLGQSRIWQIGSAGVRAGDGFRATALTQSVMVRRGLSVDNHRSRPVDADLLQSAGVVVVMAEAHREVLIREFPAAPGSILLLSELVDEQYDIADPVGGAEQDYDSCADTIARILQHGFEKLAALADTG